MFEKNKWYLSHCSYEGNRSCSTRDREQVHIRLMLGKKPNPKHSPFRSRAEFWIDKTTRVPQTIQGTLPQCRHFHQHEVMTATFFLVTTLFYQYYKIRHTLDFAQRQEGLLLQEVVNLGHQVISQWRAPFTLPILPQQWLITNTKFISETQVRLTSPVILSML